MSCAMPQRPYIRIMEESEGAGMRRVVVDEWMSLDGVVQAPGAPEEDTTGGFQHACLIGSGGCEGACPLLSSASGQRYSLPPGE